MAVQDSENPAHPGARLSPGDAAFERLRQREASRSRDDSAVAPESESVMFIGPPGPPATAAPAPATSAAPPAIGLPELSPASPAIVPAKSTLPPPASPQVLAPVHADAPADRILAMAAAFGIEAASPASPDETPLAVEHPAAAEVTGTPDPEPAVAAEAPDPAPAIASAAAPSSETPRTEVPHTPAPRPADATAARLEAALLDQLRSLEETLVEDAPPAPARLPRAAPLRPATGARRPSVPGATPPRSVFAPDPVRQRTYVDLRNPAPVPEADDADNPPWRKYLDERPRRETAGRALSHRPVSPPAGRPSPVVAAAYDRKAEVEERGRGIRAMTAAAVLGLGVGLGLLVLVRPFVDSGAPAVVASETRAQQVATLAEADRPATAPRAAGPVNQALATLLTDPPVSRAASAGPAVISEPGTSQPAVVASSPAAAEPVAPPAPPVVIRPPPGEARAVARVPDFETADSAPLAYGPAIPSYDPVRQQLLTAEEDANPAARPPTTTAARATADEKTAPSPVRPGRATINDFVNLRAKPDNASPVVAILAEGLAVKVIACDYWCEVEAGGKRGFVYKKFVSR